MKRILTVLVLLALCGMAYSVTGKVYTQMDGTGISLGDTGTDMNFDGFTFTYKLSAPLKDTDVGVKFGYFAPIGSLENPIGGTGFTATSPGYFQISSVKLGEALTVGIDAKWYTLGSSTNHGQTNLTTKDLTASIAFNSLTLDPKIVYVVNDTTTLTMDWGDKPLPIGFYGGSSSVTTSAGKTNTGAISGWQFAIPAKLNTKVGDLAIEAYPYFYVVGETWAGILNNPSVQTNNTTYGKTAFGGYLQGTYPLNETMKAQGKVSLDSASDLLHEVTMTTTNDTSVYSLDLGLYGELIWAVAPQTTVNLGLGYMVPMNDGKKTVNATTTNVFTTTSKGLQGYDAVIDFGGSTKFAQNWTLGINGQMSYAPAQTANNLVGTSTTNADSSDSAIAFNNSAANSVNWDLGDNAKSMYIQYDIDTVSIRFAITAAGAGVFNAGRLNLSYTY